MVVSGLHALRAAVDGAGALDGPLQLHGAAGSDLDAAGFLAASFTLANIVEVFGAAKALGSGLLNSCIVAFFTTAVAIVVGAPAAYALARLSMPGANPILLIVLATQMFPAIVIAIPLFILMARLGLVDTRLSLIIVYLSFNLPIAIWILRSFFLAIPARSRARSGGGWSHGAADLPADRAADLAATAVSPPLSLPSSNPGTSSSSPSS